MSGTAESGRARVRVTVDRVRCNGHARCASLAPDVYPLDEEGYAVGGQRIVPAGSEQRAEQGALACPELAIAVRR